MTDTRFACPKCGKMCIVVHVKKNHFGVCNHCRVGWHIGYNLFTVPEDIQAQADENMAFLEKNYEHIDIDDF